MNTVLSQHLVPDRYVGSATSILTLGRSLGQTIMTGVYGAVLTLVIRANLHGTSFKAVNAAISANSATTVHDPHAAAAILTGLHGVFIMVVIIMLLVIVINWCDPTGTLFNKIGGLPHLSDCSDIRRHLPLPGRHAGLRFVLLPVARLLPGRIGLKQNDHHRHVVPAFSMFIDERAIPRII